MELPNKTILTPDQACALLEIKKSRLYHMVFKKKVPFIKVGASLRFDYVALLTWLESKKVEVTND